jgi:hypothetical protein
MPLPSPPFLSPIKVTPHNEVSFVGRTEMFHLLLINNIKNTWMNKKGAQSSHFLSQYLEFSPLRGTLIEILVIAVNIFWSLK